MYVLRFLRWSRTWSSLTVGATLLPQSPSCSPSNSRGVRREAASEDWGESVVEYLSLLLTRCYKFVSLAHQGVRFLWLSFSGWHTCRSPSCYSLHPLPSSAPAAPWPSWPHPYTTEQHPCTLPSIPVPASSACAVPSCPLVWPAGLDSAMPVSCLPLLIFLHLGVQSSCALWKESLKICQLRSAPMSLRTISQGVLLTNSLKSWKFACLKFRVLTLLFTWTQDGELHQCMITAAQAASSLDVTDELIWIGEHQVQYCILLCRSVNYLAQEVILNAF